MQIIAYIETFDNLQKHRQLTGRLNGKTKNTAESGGYYLVKHLDRQVENCLTVIF